MRCLKGARRVVVSLLALLLVWGCGDSEKDPPGAFNLLSPADGATDVSAAPMLDWEDSSGADAYQLLIDDDPDFSSPVLEELSLAESMYFLPASVLRTSATYYWRVTARNAGGSTPASNNDFSFTTAPPGTGSLAWAVRAGGARFDGGAGVAVQSDGSVLVTGLFRGSATFGPGETNETALTSDGASSDIFLARYNADGTLDWVSRAGGAEYDIGQSVAALSDGSALVMGSFNGSATFGPGETNETSLTSDGAYDIFLARYDSDGTLAWATRAGGTGRDEGYAVAALPDGSALVTGDFLDAATFGAGEANEANLTSDGSASDIFLARYNLDGTLEWAVRAGGTSSDGGRSVAVLSDGSALVTGDFGGSATFGAGESNETALTSEGNLDIFLARYNPDGTLDWAKRAGGNGLDWGFGVGVLSDGSALVTGDFCRVATFGPGEANETTLTTEGNPGDWDIFLARFAPGGSLAWAVRAGAADNDCGRDVAVLSDGSALVTGFFNGTATFGLGESNQTALTSTGLQDIFLARFNPGGTLDWARAAGGTGNDRGWSVASVPDGSAVVTGSFEDTATFGPGEANEATLISAGDADIFLARFNP